MPYPIHVSDVRTFMQCRRKWDWSSILRQGLEKNVTYLPFFSGRAVHYCLQKYYEQVPEGREEVPSSWLPGFVETEVKAMGRLWDQEQQLILEQVDLIQGILDHYYRWIVTDTSEWRDSNLQFLALEMTFQVPLVNPSGAKSKRVFLEGRFDGVVRRRDNGSYWLWECKTAASIDRLLHSLDNDMQCGTYILAAEKMLGIHISGVLYNILRKKTPTTPRLLKAGTLSQAQDIDTTAEHYIATARAAHSDWTDEQVKSFYGPFLEMLLQKGNTFFKRVPIRRTRSEIEELSKVLWTVALEMTRPSTPIYPAPSWSTCTYCSFKAPCMAMSAGVDFGSILEADYRPRRMWDELSGEEPKTED